MNVQRCLQSLFEQLSESDMHTHSTHNRPLHVAVYEKLYRKVFGAYVDLKRGIRSIRGKEHGNILLCLEEQFVPEFQ